ncbi:MAG: pilus assembly protein [Betaproteobacteria bacterium]|nr:MAG: pilus assembly protein [Betaproteobacteria bacterium]
MRGVAAVEFALLLPPLLLMLFGTTEFGRAIYTYNTLDKAARDAVRYLSQHGPGDTTAQAEARCLAAYGNTTCSGSPLAPGLTTANVTVCDALSCPATHAAQPTGLGVISLVSVTVTGYAYSSMVQFVMPDITFKDISVTMMGQL